jgi:hypothetical protein
MDRTLHTRICASARSLKTTINALELLYIYNTLFSFTDMNTKEAFKNLMMDKDRCDKAGIKDSTRRARLNYLNTGRTVSTEKMEELLTLAGYKVIQEKQWGK